MAKTKVKFDFDYEVFSVEKMGIKFGYIYEE